MNGLQTQHPEDGLLLRYADGELPPRDAAEIRSHLEACWQCRSELDELGRVVGECVRYRKALHEYLPRPPLLWSDLSSGFAEVDAALARPGLLVRLGRALLPPAPMRWAALAAGLILAVLVVDQMWNPPSARAAELLTKAVAVEESRGRTVRKLAIRTKQRSMTRWMGVPAGGAKPAVPAAFELELKSLEALFTKSNYNWDDPLSAKSFQAWRDGLEQKSDEVTSQNGWHLIKTSAPGSELAEASLKLRAGDLEPLAARFEFRNDEWVEISELPSQTEFAVEAAPAPAGESSPAPAPEARSAEVVARPPATLGQELQVLAALQRLGADLGDPVEVQRSGGAVVVSGLGVEAGRRREIEAAMEPLENVVVRFSEGAPPAQVAEAGRPADISVRAEGSPLQKRIEARLGGRVQYDRVAAQILDQNEMIMSRVYALRRLADRFPESAEAQLSGPDRRLLRSLHQDHAAQLAAQAAGLERVLKPVLHSLGAGVAEPAPPTAESWQEASRRVFGAARGVELLLARLLGGTNESFLDTGLPGELAARLADLRAAAETCRHASAGGGDTR